MKAQRPTILRQDVIAVGFIMLLVGLLWLPFGFKSTIGLLEEWFVFERSQQGVNMLWLPQNPTRPMLFAPNALLHALDPTSFASFGITYVFLFTLKGVLVYALLRRLLPGLAALALITAALFIIYPADRGLMSFRTINVHTHLVMGLLALYLSVRYWQHPRRWFWPLIWASQFICLMIYEVLYPLLLAWPLVLLLLNRRLDTRLLRVSALWLVLPAALALRVALLLPTLSTGYIGNILDITETYQIDAPMILTSIGRMYSRHISNWLPVNLPEVWSPLALPALVIALTGAVIVWVLSKSARLSIRLIFTLIGAGVVTMLLGFAAFLPGHIQLEDWRVFMVTSLGAALIAGSLISALSAAPLIGRILTAGTAALALFLASLFALTQLQFMAHASDHLMHTFASIIEAAPAFDDDAAIVLVDTLERYRGGWALANISRSLRGALGAFYGRPVDAYFCPQFTLSSGPCRLEADAIRIRDDNRDIVLPYEQAIIFQNHENGAIRLAEPAPPYDPYQWIDQSAPPPGTVYSFLPCWPLDSCRQRPTDTTPQKRILIDGSQVMRGSGWLPPNPNYAVIGTYTRNPSLVIYPMTDRPLRIQFYLPHAQHYADLENLTLYVNDRPIFLPRQPRPSGMFYSGIIQQHILQPETRLTFVTGGDPDEMGIYLLGFDWLKIEPA